MILTCPSCGTQYVVKDGAIPPEGRQVRCASCKHSWHQDPEPGDPSAEPLPAPVAPSPEPTEQPDPQASAPEDNGAAGASDEEESFAEAALIDPSGGPEMEERAYEESLLDAQPEATTAETVQSGAVAPPGPEAAPQPLAGEFSRAENQPGDWREPPQLEPQTDEFSPFSEMSDDFDEGRRSPLLTILLVVLLVAALAAAFWFFAPDAWKVRLGLAAAGASPLALVTTHMDRQRLASGQETLNVTGRVINNTGQSQDVPPLQAQLRSRSGQLVYKWTIAPPAATLPPGGSASFNSTEVSVPPGGDELTISVGAPQA